MSGLLSIMHGHLVQRASLPSSATTLLPGQDKPGSSGPMSGAFWFVVSCGVRLSEVGLSEIRKPQVMRHTDQFHWIPFRLLSTYQTAAPKCQHDENQC
jgi:hypothetical protein